MPARCSIAIPLGLAVRPESVQEALREYQVQHRNRRYGPDTTIRAWMSQIASQDGSCRHAVSQVVAHHASAGRPISARTGAYTQARQRLDIRVIQKLARDLARRLETDRRSQLLARPLFAVDGTTVSCPDTLAITRKYPKQDTHYAAEGLGFPTIRLTLIVSLTTGAIMDIGIAPFRGAGTHEIAIFQRLWPNLHRGDIVVGDRAYAASTFFYWLPYHGIDLMSRRSEQFDLASRRVVKVLGRQDHVRMLRKSNTKPQWMPALMYRRTPTSFPVRATGLWTSGRDGRSRLELLSTLDGSVTKPQLAEVYRARWSIETDIRSFKVDLGADILRCQTAEMVEKEIWMTVLTYNAVRYLISQASARAGCPPRSVSFKGALQVVNAFSPVLSAMLPHELSPVIQRMYAAIASHTVGDRPDRVEPRAVKRRPKKTERLLVSREEARRQCLKRKSS